MTTSGLVGARIVCIIIGYVFGMIQTAVFYGRLKGVDIRKVGSGNAGTTNTLRVLGPKAGAVVLLGDMLKCMAAILITYLIFGRSNPEYIILFMAYTAAGTVLGHDFPFFLKFKGGKGFATLMGCILGYNPIAFVVAGILVIIITFATDYIVIATLTMLIAFPVFVGIYTHNIIYALILAIGSLCIFLKHIPNFKKIIKKEEIGIRSSFTKKHRI